MVCRIVQAVVVLVACVLLASCSVFNRRPIERPLYYDVRDISVIADSRVSPVLIAGIDRRISASIGATRRPEPLPRVVLAVRVENYAVGTGIGRRLNEARFRVSAISVENGETIATGVFDVYSTSENPLMAEESLAEEIAARVRYAFSLTTPSLPKPPRARAATVRPVTSPDVPDAAANPAPVTVEPVPAPIDGGVEVSPEAPGPAPQTGAVSPGTNTEEGALATIDLSRRGPSKTVDCKSAQGQACPPAQP
ncbi:hypothetical protein HFC70_16080 [Agrobacterium sp. a22-2]|uniref:hypothetical protein n=1 Tax=Agrobacterium sp. a22-2 TaxID=2283840 RepID=UPI001445D8A7|nr:hypothetical protein [Agrobacterium sp. a22-2]NKN37871.1 hypothetical protein [Agrobacterium sp. a22-2]